MPLLTLSQAAKLAGRSKSTLSRAAKNGRLSVAKRDGRELLIDVAELERAFGPLQQRNVAENVPAERPATPEADLLKTRIAELEQDRRELKDQLEQERAERGRLVATVEDQARTMRLLEDQRKPAPKRGWWRLIWTK